MFSVSAGDNTTKIILIMVMIMFLFIQYEYEPFIVYEGNQMEFILLSCLAVIIALQTVSSINIDFQRYSTGFLIIFPLILMVYFIFRYSYLFKQRVKYLIVWGFIIIDRMEKQQWIKGEI